MVQNGRLINQESTWELNRTVLQRIDHHIEDILITAGHVTLYEFDVDACQWSRKDVEGSLFVVKRRTKPRFQFIVMNRRSTENLVEDLLDDFEYELQVPYLLYRNGAQEVNGIWFYNPRECEEVANLFSRILNAYSKNPPKRKVFSPPQGDEFQELEAVPTPATVEGPLEPQAVPSAAGVTEGSLERFFNIATHLGSHDSASSCAMRPNVVVHPSPVLTPVGVIPPFSPVLAMPPPPPPPPPPVPLSTSQPVSEAGSSKSLEVPLKPYFFVPPPLPSSQPTFLHPPPPLQPSVGAPLLQPFPPPVPSPSLTPNSVLPSKPVISREGVRDALFRLVQNDTFIDMVFEEMLKAQRLPA
ncbi:hypothetical protein GOP47_0013940 [Adiantum capillus-veneris]|uniref:mRNA-decapping enzyme-like protein n=1 Tax=Adiantum capillus-veneris TaxID=13818 RepID=A0A9D4UPH0_ADICA|nr:hypothetical protein GOP47_0013940 [Adiantum capillus-veneris]